MDLDLRGVKFSKRDTEKGIMIPKKLTPLLAEDIGIHIGDGSIDLRKDRMHSTTLTHSSNTYETDYLDYVIRLKKRLYNLNNYNVVKRNNERNLIFNSLAISTFYSTVFEIPIGKKSDIDIPAIIKNSDDSNVISSYIRGFVDTDFGLIKRIKYGKIHPSLDGTSSSERLIVSLSFLFDKLNIKHYMYTERQFDKRTSKVYTRYKIAINGFSRISLCLKAIKPRNQKYIRKIGDMGPKRFEFEG